jgi:hypothetical protein
MGLYSVKIGEIDTSLGSSGGRILDIRTSSSHSFTTPARPICAEEITAKNFLGYRGEIYAPLAVLPLNINGERLQKFGMNNGTVKKLRQTLQSLSDSTWLMPSFPVIQTDNALSCERDRLHKIAFEMQVGTSGLDYICMPWIDGSISEFEAAVKDWSESAEKQGFGCVVQLDMKDKPENLGRKLDFLAEMSDTGIVSIINLIYANPENYPTQYAEVWSRRESLNTLINCSEVPRGVGKGDMMSEIQTKLISYGIDSFSRKKNVLSQKAVGYLAEQPPPENLSGIRKYRMAIHSASVQVKQDAYAKVEHEYRCNCSICRGKSIGDLTNRFSYKDNGEIEKSGMAYFSHIHDHQSDQAEIDRAKSFIRSCEMSSYETLQQEERRKLGKLMGP